MPIEVLLAPVGAGKTEHALNRLVQTLDERPFARVWVLVSGRRQEDAFRQRLAQRDPDRRVYFNVEFFTFYQLYHRLLNITRQPPRMLDDAARFGLLRAILTGLQQQGELQVFDEIATMPGFVEIVAAFINELKQNLVTPDTFIAAAQSPKDRDLALIYARYQAQLQQHELVDRDGEGWLALAVLQAEKGVKTGSDVDLLLVDGYDQFTPLQASLLMLVAARAKQALVTLATVPGRAHTVGRRFAEVLDQLRTFSPETPRIRVATDLGGVNRPAPIQHVIDYVFWRDAPQHPAGGRVALLEAPTPTHEAGAIMRRVKQLLLTPGTQPDDIIIALRDWPRYAAHLATFGRDYGVPLVLHQGEPLHHNPAIIMLLNLLSLHEHDFRRRDLLDVLRSPYFAVPGIGREQVELLQRISQQALVTGGRDNWLAAISSAHIPLAGEDEFEQDASVIDAQQAQDLYAALQQFFEAVTPPPAAELDDYVRWLSDLIGPDTDMPDEEETVSLPAYQLRMPDQLKRETAPGIENRDRAALDTFMRVLRSLRAAEELLAALQTGRMMTRARFLAELRTAVENTAVNRGQVRNGRVLVTTVADARGLPHRHVFIPGLSEGIFPLSQPEDPLYLDSERRALNERGVRMETQAERAADEGLFYEIIGLARETLTLSRPTVQDGAPWLPSHLWRAVMVVLSDAPEIIQRVRPGEVVAAGEVACVDEALLALADGLSAAAMPENVASLYGWVMQAHGTAWERIARARHIEAQRQARHLAHDRYTGRLTAPDLIAHAAAQLGPNRVWSASQLNDYGVCGFRFFAKRLLRLEAWEEPEEALTAAKLGTVNHTILEQTYGEIGRRGLAIAPENLGDALKILARVTGDVLATAPQQVGFPDDGVWEQEKAVLTRRLESLVKLDFSDQSPIAKHIPGERTAYSQEGAFGPESGVPVAIPVTIEGKPETLHVRGFIDRMDRVGDQIVLVDYKTNSGQIPVSDMREGRNFQMMLYLRAAAYILAARDPDLQIAGGLFWHIRSQKASGALKLDDKGREALDEAGAHLGRYIAAGRRGDFTVQPRKLDKGRCVSYCEFSQLCRTASTSRQKTGDDA